MTALVVALGVNVVAGAVAVIVPLVVANNKNEEIANINADFV